MSDRAVMISIRPEYADKIFDGKKCVELRRVRPRVECGDLVLVYVTSPVKAVTGAFEVDRVIEDKPRKVWEEVKGKAGLTRRQFDMYYAGISQAFAIFVRKSWRLQTPIDLQRLRKRLPWFHPPQSYHYLAPAQRESVFKAAEGE
ncbi:MAG: ASCH domain-containing protein [Planctomycetota bacterium]